MRHSKREHPEAKGSCLNSDTEAQQEERGARLFARTSLPRKHTGTWPFEGHTLMHLALNSASRPTVEAG